MVLTLAMRFFALIWYVVLILVGTSVVCVGIIVYPFVRTFEVAEILRRLLWWIAVSVVG